MAMKTDMNQLLLTLSMLISQGITLSDEQIQSIHRILLGAIDPSFAAPQAVKPHAPETGKELVYGLAGLAALFGVSVPTAAKYRVKYDAARVHFGGKKLVWDKQKRLDLAKQNKW